MIEVLGLLLSNFECAIASRMWEVDLKGLNAVDYLYKYHITILSDFSEEKHLLIKLIRKIITLRYPRIALENF